MANPTISVSGDCRRIILAARPRSEPSGAGRGLAQERDLDAPEPARQIERLHQSDERRQRALRRRRRFGRRLSQAGARSGAAGHSSAAGQGAQHGKRVVGQGAREQGALGSRHRDGCGLGKTSTFRCCATARSSSGNADSVGNHIGGGPLLSPSSTAPPQLLAHGKFFSLSRLLSHRIGNETFGHSTTAARRLLKRRQERHRATPEITRFKGLAR